MAKIRVAFEVDQSQLFDTIQKMGGDCSMIGERIVGVLLSGEAPWREQLGMAVYGIQLWPPDGDPIAVDAKTAGGTR